MRSRYSAYATRNVDYVLDTCVKDEDSSIDPEGTRKWAEESEWKGLEILKTEKGGPFDEEGTVEFKARYVQRGVLTVHHEISSFVKKEGRWLFESGELIPETVVRTQAKVGRNEPCPCGSGKKYKACHGR
jgi:SEC-C motif-containing protein